ncbi:MAG: hypothetical protein H7Y22_04040 [Gemmatimonadaceae bacterium]|nr:hypothetical protein [Gloeobacterales cyanobacterium ES-bin-141]
MHRILVVGTDVSMVQQVSRYCLVWGAEVLPYYSTPTAEEICLFSPEVWVLCPPLPDGLTYTADQPHILWSEQPVSTHLPVASTREELVALLLTSLT